MERSFDGFCTKGNFQVRKVPELNGYAQHRRVHRLGFPCRAVHRHGLAAQPGLRADRLAHAHLPDPHPHRRAGRLHGGRQARPRHRFHRNRGRHRRVRLHNANGGHADWPAGRPGHQEVGRVGQGLDARRLRDAGRQLLRRHPRPAAVTLCPRGHRPLHDGDPLGPHGRRQPAHALQPAPAARGVRGAG